MKENFVKKEFNLVFGLNFRKNLYSISKIFLVSLIIIFFNTSFSEAAKKKDEPGTWDLKEKYKEATEENYRLYDR